MKYLLNLRGAEALSIESLETGGQNQCVFALGLTRTKKLSISQKLESEFDAGEQQKFGALGVYKLSLKENFSGRPLPTYKSGAEESEKSNRIFWKDLWK